MATGTPASALATKLLSITDEIGPVHKGGFNAHFNYAFYREEDFIEAVRPLLVKHGVALIPNVLRDTITPVTVQSGRIENLVSVAVEYTLIDTESGDSLQVVGIGHGQDAGDKGLPKAMTGAMKAFLRQLFMISAGSADAEDDNQDAPPARGAQQQVMPRGAAPPQGQAPAPQQAQQPVGDNTGFCPTHRKPFRIGNKGNRYCPTKLGENPDGTANWCNQGYDYDQQYGRYQPGGAPAVQNEPQPQGEPQYDQPPPDVDDIPF